MFNGNGNQEVKKKLVSVATTERIMITWCRSRRLDQCAVSTEDACKATTKRKPRIREIGSENRGWRRITACPHASWYRRFKSSSIF